MLGMALAIIAILSAELIPKKYFTIKKTIVGIRNIFKKFTKNAIFIFLKSFLNSNLMPIVKMARKIKESATIFKKSTFNFKGFSIKANKKASKVGVFNSFLMKFSSFLSFLGDVREMIMLPKIRKKRKFV